MYHGNMNTTTKQAAEKGSETKKPKSSITLDQSMINMIEKRLSLTGGSRLIEIGAALALRFGKWQEIKRKALNLQHQASTAFDDYGRLNETVSKELNAKAREAEELSKVQRTKENSEFTHAAEAYIISAYGEKTKDEYNRPRFYGERVEIMENKHLHKIW
jgi:hypothetical protein